MSTSITPFQTVEDARAAYQAASDELHKARTREYAATRHGYCDDERLVRATLDAQSRVTSLGKVIVDQFGDPAKAAGCATCLYQTVFPGGPRHQASARCKSGKHPHCTCDTCF